MFPELLSPEELEVQERARRFAKEKVSKELLMQMDAEEVQYPHQFVKDLAAEGLLGLRFEPKYGGHGMGWTAEVGALEEIGILGMSLGCHFSMPSIVGEGLHAFGSDEQKEKWLRPLIAGEIRSAEALTEPRGGSDFFGATTQAVRDGDDFILNGQKRFVVGAEGADIFLVYAKTAPDAHPHKSLSAFIVERDESVLVEHVYGLMGTRGGGTGRIVFKDTRVPAANLIGPLDGGGIVFNRMMIPERMTSAGGALGLGRAALEIAAHYATKRKAFGKRIIKFEGVSFRIADAVSELDAARALVWAAAKRIDAGLDARRMVSEAKKMATTACWNAINHAMQIMGGIGYTDIYPIERMLRDARLTVIWTGTNEIMNLLIQHEYLKEIEAERAAKRDSEADAINADADGEKIFE
ncbi:MAG: acyl-CoA dehydrogenase family protein [Candidatus Lernaella stagnicola]|nr:acyl-CoA dehydrogenase family protein [Candidatus Lernaella stagnicola]